MEDRGWQIDQRLHADLLSSIFHPRSSLVVDQNTCRMTSPRLIGNGRPRVS
jgi:hypothetical protein